MELGVAYFQLSAGGGATPTDSPFVSAGTWSCVSDSGSTIDVAWGELNGGGLFTDTLTLSADGNTLSGPNNVRFQVVATRR